MPYQEVESRPAAADIHSNHIANHCTGGSGNAARGSYAISRGTCIAFLLLISSLFYCQICEFTKLVEDTGFILMKNIVGDFNDILNLFPAFSCQLGGVQVGRATRAPLPLVRPVLRAERSRAIFETLVSGRRLCVRWRCIAIVTVQVELRAHRARVR